MCSMGINVFLADFVCGGEEGGGWISEQQQHRSVCVCVWVRVSATDILIIIREISSCAPGQRRRQGNTHFKES